MIGKTISHYKILEKLGEGGMGVVYKAEDTKLERAVALKFLSLTSIGAEEKKRFKREAKAAASLNHPNIAIIFAIDETDDQTFIAMEYVEGKSLEELVGSNGGKPMPIDKAIDYATQTAAGLQAAHKKGITHRDIKSANIMITEDGQVKIMDFGLAKLANRSKLTQLGTTLGTAAYMSPEQSRGENTDHRADIWSLGVVLYEMISGRMPFKGDYEQAVIYSIQNEDPEPLTALRTGVPIALDGIIAKALAKDADTRYQHVDELPADLKTLNVQPDHRFVSSRMNFQSKATGTVRSSGGVPWIVVMLLVVSAVLITYLIVGLDSGQIDTSSSVRATVNLAPTHHVSVEGFPSLAFSPDGTSFVYVAAEHEGDSRLYLRQMGAFEHQAIPETDGASSPFFSDDGQWVGFFARGKLKKVSLLSGAVQTLDITTASGRGGTWGPDDVIYFCRLNSPVLQIFANGGVPQAITTLDSVKGETTHRWPQILPGGNAILFTIGTRGIYDDASIAIKSLKTGERKVLIEGGSYARYSPTGHLLYSRAGNLLAVPFSLDQLEVTGTPIRVLEGVLTHTLTGAGQFDFSKNGSLAYVAGEADRDERTFVWVDHKGDIQQLSTNTKTSFILPRLSPDGKQVAVAIDEGANTDLWKFDITDGQLSTLSRLTFEGSRNRPAAWSPDGTRIAFGSNRNGVLNLFSKTLDGEAEQLLISENIQVPISWSSDGDHLVYEELHPINAWDIGILSMAGKPTARPFLQSANNERGGSISPNNDWIAYSSDESERAEIYIQSFPSGGRKRQISTEGGSDPVWAPGGRELFYRNGDKMMAVTISNKADFFHSTPRLLFESFKDPTYVSLPRQYDISSDGDRFLVVKYEQKSVINEFKIVVNWFQELKRLVPGGK